MNNKKINITVTDIILLVISVIFLIGILTFIKPCGPKDDGTWMNCHWAGNILAGLAVVLTVNSLAHLFIPNTNAKIGVAASQIPIALLTALVPGTLINLCMMNDMTCNAITKPVSILFAVLIVIVSACDILLNIKKSKKSK